MARRKSTTLTEVELEFMRIVWSREEVTTEDIQNTLGENDRHLTDGAIRRVLAILMEKGYLSRRRQGIGFFYKARVEKESAYGSIFRDLLNRAFDGSGSLMIASFLDTVDIKRDELDQIKRLIEDREKGGEDGKC